MRHLYPALPSFVSADASAGHVVLVGDAAHAMTPNLGQGACTAILDADALTRALAAAPPGPAGIAEPCAPTTGTAAAAPSGPPSPPGRCTAS